MSNVVGMDEVIKNLDRFVIRYKSAASVALNLTAAEVVNYAKKSAPWTDRTGDARGSIHFESSDTDDRLARSVGIGMDYGVYLELSNGGRYRVIDPAVFSFGRQSMITNLRGIM